MNLIISGPQGSGKGTQAQLIADKFNLTHLEMGKVFRQISQENSSLGRKVAEIINKGVLVPDEITFKLAEKILTKDVFKKGFVIDGFPRTLTQIKWLDDELIKNSSKIDGLIYLKLSNKEAVRRLSARRICPKCGANFNILTKPPKKDGVCDKCQAKLIVREDETPEAINKRLDEYQKQTAPMIDYYRNLGKIIEVDGERPIETIFKDIVNRLED